MNLRSVRALIAQAQSGSLSKKDLVHSEMPRSLGFGLRGNSECQSVPIRALASLLTETYGGDETTLRRQLDRIDRLCALFLDLYGDGPVTLLRAPARINIIGEHVDYVSYLPTSSLTFGSREHDMMMLIRPLGSAQIQVASTLEGCLPFRFDFLDASEAGPEEFDESRWISFVFSRPVPIPHWSNYVKGSVLFAVMRFSRQVHRGFCFAVDSTIPPGGGASSSSALTVLAGAAIRQVNDIGFTDEELARDSSRAEWYLGTRGGAMDHKTICLARRQNSVYLSYADNRFHRLPLPADAFRWLTFYSHPADKSREIMLEYNERAAVSRLLIPAFLQDLLQSEAILRRSWPEWLRDVQEAKTEPVVQIRQILQSLPESITLADVEQSHPKTYVACEEAFPALVADRRHSPLKVRDLALHHLGEILRVNTAVQVLQQLGTGSNSGDPRAVSDGMRTLGMLLDQSHQSLRDLYRISTPLVEELLQIIKSEPEVYGARLMGGGFGGNLLALVPREAVPRLLHLVQSRFYSPPGRNGVKESLVMVSTPGDGLSRIDPESGCRKEIEIFNANWTKAEQHRREVWHLLDSLGPSELSSSVWPVIVAAGKGERAKKSGLQVPKPLASVAGAPSILHVLKAVRESCPGAVQPIVIVSLETEPSVRQTLAREAMTYVVQAEPLGTGDAVFWATKLMRDFEGWALVVWSTQPAILPDTIRRSLMLATLFPEYEMVVPTVLTDQPYAPLWRDTLGRVEASQETHLEKAPLIHRGETNIGLFLIKCRTMVAQLEELRRLYWQGEQNRYNRPGGELGFPNELITSLAGHSHGVLASPIADWREAQGIKSLEDLARCEQYMAELRQ
jgi:galactokinase/CTP:molybdopterin cytidylyltransferase MocA